MKASHRAYPLLILLLALSFAYWLGGAFSVISELRSGTQHVRPPFDFGLRLNVITYSRPEGIQAGAEAGDRLVEWNGRRFTGYSVMRETLRSVHPGSLVTAVIQRRDGTIKPVSIELAPQRREPAPLSEWLRDITVYLIFPLFCLVLGFWVAAARPFDKNAWFLLAIMISLEFLVPEGSWSQPWQTLGAVWGRLESYSWPVWMLLFGIYFPERSRLDRNAPWIKWLLILVIGISSLPVLVMQAGMELSFDAVRWLRPVMLPMDLVRRVSGMAGISLFFVNLGVKSGAASTRDAKRRIGLVWLGAAVGLTPSFLVALESLLSGDDFGSGIPAWVLYFAFGCVAIFPLTLAYVILVQRAMDVRMAIRQSVQYALARGGLWLVRACMFVLAIQIFVEVSLNKSGFTLGQVGLLAIGAALLILRKRYSGRMQRWVDRRFFREVYSAEQVLGDLSNQARKFVDARPLLETVTRRISETLHVPHISVLLRETDGYRLAPSSQDGFAGTLALASTARSIEHLRAGSGPSLVYFDDPESWLRDMPAAEQQTLKQLDAQLLLPLTGRNDLIGVMALGPKRSEEPYSKTDLQLLQSVADQTGLAIENSRLITSLAEEAARRERFNRELEIAREVQERLFPQFYPAVAGLDCAGHCRPALGVGGDYYDFIPLPEGRLGIAVGDVSGKGISAALLMASLRASLRGQTMGGPADLAALMGNVNALLYEASTANRYATFFYAQYDPRGGMLAFVNAGHNPPVVLRGDEVIRLEADGPVVGLLPAARYTQSSLVLSPGDILLAYTDGISEAMTNDDEEWGEDRMIGAARDSRALPAAQMIERLMAAADVFTAGAPQHDDMTLVVVKLS